MLANPSATKCEVHLVLTKAGQNVHCGYSIRMLSPAAEPPYGADEDYFAGG
jgi:hypothetical protein